MFFACGICVIPHSEQTESELSFWSFDWFFEHSANGRATLDRSRNMFIWRRVSVDFDLSGEQHSVHSWLLMLRFNRLWTDGYGLYLKSFVYTGQTNRFNKNHLSEYIAKDFFRDQTKNRSTIITISV